MRDLSLHILDVTENSIRAGAQRVEIHLDEDRVGGWLDLHIRDNGQGMSPELTERAMDPFTTTKEERRVGLGLALLRRAALQTGGDCRIDSAQGNGTRVHARFSLNHVDCKPVGDVGQTLAALIASNPGIDFQLEVRSGDDLRRLDTRDLRSAIGSAPLSSAEGLRRMSRWIRDGLALRGAPGEGNTISSEERHDGNR